MQHITEATIFKLIRQSKMVKPSKSAKSFWFKKFIMALGPIAALILAISCNTNSGSKKDPKLRNHFTKSISSSTAEKSYESLAYAKVPDPNDTSKCNIIDKNTAIILMPDSSWIAQQQKEMGDDDWNEVVADHDYYLSEAMDALKSIGIETTYFDNSKRYFKLIKSNGKIVCIDKQKIKDNWGLILFNSDKDPVFWNSTSIDDAINDLFTKQK